MSNKDFLNLGNVYSDMFATLEDNLVSEGAVESVGEAPLTDGGPQEKGGFVEPEVDITKDKDKYNIKNLSYDNSEDISSDAGDNTDGDAVVGHENEEDEEILHETEKIAKERLNNFMKRKSVFDKLYDKVMVNGPALGNATLQVKTCELPVGSQRATSEGSLPSDEVDGVLDWIAPVSRSSDRVDCSRST